MPTLAELKHVHMAPQVLASGTQARGKRHAGPRQTARRPAANDTQAHGKRHAGPRARAPRGLGHGALVADVWRGPRGACAGTTWSWAWRTSR